MPCPRGRSHVLISGDEFIALPIIREPEIVLVGKFGLMSGGGHPSPIVVSDHAHRDFTN